MVDCNNNGGDNGDSIYGGDGCSGWGRGAVGYWGGEVYKTIQCNNIYQKELANLEAQLKGTGYRANLWRAVPSGNQCSCYKKSNEATDRKCRSCYGSSKAYVPGYAKFGYTTLFMSSVDDGTVFTGTELVYDFKSAKVQLAEGTLSGTIESIDYSFTRDAIGSVWEYDVASFRQRGDDAAVLVEYSLDTGTTWTEIDQLPTANPSSGAIRFRATLTRTSINIRSPLFEIVRARFAYIDSTDERCDGSFTNGPWIWLGKAPIATKENFIKSDYGDLPIAAPSLWTIALSAFDPTIVKGSSDELLEGPNIIIEILDGVYANRRFIAIDWALSDPGGFKIITQTFSTRVEVPDGPASLVW